MLLHGERVEQSGGHGIKALKQWRLNYDGWHREVRRVTQVRAAAHFGAFARRLVAARLCLAPRVSTSLARQAGPPLRMKIQGWLPCEHAALVTAPLKMQQASLARPDRLKPIRPAVP